jgi:hypothetical protein
MRGGLQTEPEVDRPPSRCELTGDARARCTEAYFEAAGAEAWDVVQAIHASMKATPGKANYVVCVIGSLYTRIMAARSSARVARGDIRVRGWSGARLFEPARADSERRPPRQMCARVVSPFG